MNLTASDFQTIRAWIYRNARPLDLARWQYHFENGPQSAVLAALTAYQNPDGGFGHAVEPDFWNPNSSPYATSIAIRTLVEIGFHDSAHPVIQSILHYLDTTPYFDGAYWQATIPTHADYPHAPWWTDATYDWGYTPTAVLAGFILAHASPASSLYQKAARIAAAAVDTYLHGVMPDGSPYNCVRREGEIDGIAAMLSCIEPTPLAAQFDLPAIRALLNQQAQTFIEKDESKWNTYVWRPSGFIHSPESIFYPGNEQIMQDDITFILNQRTAEGIWDITWSWGADEESFAVAKIWWKAFLIIDNLRLLKSFGRLEA